MRVSLGLLMIVWLASGCGGGGGGGAASTSTSGSTGSGSSGSSAGSGTSGTSTAAPTLVQMNTYQTTGSITENNSSVQFKSLTAAGHTLWVAVTVPDYGGIHTITVSDTQGNAFTQLDQQNDGPPGSQTVAQFYAANIVGDTTVADTITVNWSNDNYKGILITEVAGTTTAPLVGHASAIQDALAEGTNKVTSGPIAVGAAQTPALLVAVSVNTSGGASDLGGSGYPGPAAGSGMTPVATFWDWGATLATFVTASVTSAESVSSVFNSPDTDSYVTVAAVFH
jgi:hypothetical protein